MLVPLGTSTWRGLGADESGVAAGVPDAGLEEALVGGVRDAPAEVAVDRGAADDDRIAETARRLLLDQDRHLL